LGTAGARSIIAATANIGDGFNGAPSSSRSLFAASIGIVTGSDAQTIGAPLLPGSGG
jgi:hypothetical protein